MKKTRIYRIKLDDVGISKMESLLEKITKDSIILSTELSKNKQEIKVVYNYIFGSNISNICCMSQLLNLSKKIQHVYENKDKYEKR